MRQARRHRQLHPPESAGRLAVASVPMGYGDETLGAVRDKLLHELLKDPKGTSDLH